MNNDLISFEIDTTNEKEIKNISLKKIEFVEINIPNYHVNDFLIQIIIRGSVITSPTNKWFLHPKISPMQVDISQAVISNSNPLNILREQKLYLKLISDKVKTPVGATIYYKIH